MADIPGPKPLRLDSTYAQEAEGNLGASAGNTPKDHLSISTPNTVITFQAGFDEEVKDKLCQGLFSRNNIAVLETTLNTWEEGFAYGTHPSWVVACRLTAALTPLATVPGESFRDAIENYLFEHLSVNQAANVSAALDALRLETDAAARDLLGAPAIRSKGPSNAVSPTSFVIGILTLTPSGRVLLHAWHFIYELKHANGGVVSVAGLCVVPFELEIDPTKYRQVQIEPGDYNNERNRPAKLSKAMTELDKNITRLYTPSSPRGLGQPFDVTLFHVLNILGNINIVTQSLEVVASLSIPLVGKIPIGSVKGDLKRSIILGVDAKVASGSLEFFVEEKYLKVKVDLKTTAGQWNRTVPLLPQQLFRIPNAKI